MKLRKLCAADAPRMLEWMKDPKINCFFRWNSSDVSAESVNEFIGAAQVEERDRHYAVTKEDDFYIGTVSLKNIDLINKNAEYAISLHPDAIGKGYAAEATTQILSVAFSELGLRKVYLNVRSDNLRAINFYVKYGFIFEGEFKNHLIKNEHEYDLLWYRLLNNEFFSL